MVMEMERYESKIVILPQFWRMLNKFLPGREEKEEQEVAQPVGPPNEVAVEYEKAKVMITSVNKFIRY
nr:hypothetical protein [Pyrococcus furiosus]